MSVETVRLFARTLAKKANKFIRSVPVHCGARPGLWIVQISARRLDLADWEAAQAETYTELAIDPGMLLIKRTVLKAAGVVILIELEIEERGV